MMLLRTKDLGCEGNTHVPRPDYGTRQEENTKERIQKSTKSRIDESNNT